MKRLMTDIWDGLRLQKGRTALSMLAICVGMTALTMLLAFLNGLSEKSRNIINDMGANVFLILPPDSSAPDAPPLTLDTSAVLAHSLPDAAISAIRRFDVQMHSPAAKVRVFAADDNYFRIQNWPLKSGRILDYHDHETANRAAVVHQSLAETAGWQIDSTLYLQNIPFVVAGITEKQAAALEKEHPDMSYAPNEKSIFIPFTCSEPLMTDYNIKRRVIDMIAVAAKDSSKMEAMIETSKRLLSSPHGTGNYVWITPDSVLHNVRSLQKTVALTAGSIALLCLILGGTTLMSLMTANVRDRIQEIALRRTIGATSKDIAAMFVAEACIVTLASSIIGILTAAILINIVAGYVSLPIHTGFATISIPMITAVALGSAFSYLPVRMATSITPAEALRND